MQMCLGVCACAKMSDQQLVCFKMFHKVNTVAPRHQVKIGGGQLGGREGWGFGNKSARGISGGHVSRAIVLKLEDHVVLGVAKRLMGLERDVSNGEGSGEVQDMQSVGRHRLHRAKEMGESVAVDFLGRGHESRRVDQMALTNRMHIDRNVQCGKISSGGRVIQMDVGQQDPSQFFHRPTQICHPLLQGGKG